MISAVAARQAALAAQASGSSLSSTPQIEEPCTQSRSDDHEQNIQKLTPRRRPKVKSKIGRKTKPYQRPEGRKGKEKADVIMDSDSSQSEDDKDEPFPPSTVPVEFSDSDDEDDVGDDIQPYLDVSTLLDPMRNKPPEDRILSTFQPIPDKNVFFLSKSECSLLGVSFPATLVCQQAGDTLSLLGICGLSLLTGTLELYGTTLKASHSCHRIFTPRFFPLPIIRALSGHSTSSTLQDELIPDRLSGIRNFEAVFALQELRTGIEGLGQICHTFDAMFEPPKWQKDKVSSPFKIAGLHMVSSSTKELGPFTLPPTWSNALDTVTYSERDRSINNSPPGVYIVKGPKNSGKSTFARTLSNRLLDVYHRVAFLECDIGQTEFTPTGMVSLNVVSEPLFGPPFTHPTLPNFAHFIGATTPRSSPSHYLDAISALIETYRQGVQNPLPQMNDECDVESPKISDSIPLVVNTMGWVKGLGADLNRRIESMLEPMDVFDIQAPSQDDYQYPGPSYEHTNGGLYNSYGAFSSDMALDRVATHVHILEPAVSNPTTIGPTAADYRNISLLSYFHAIFPKHSCPTDFEQVTASMWDTSRPLCGIPPFEVDCSMAFDGVYLTGAGSEDVVEEEIGRVLNGGIVGLVSCEPGTINNHDDSQALKEFGIPYSQGDDLPLPLSSRCVGLALIRGVSSPLPIAESTPSTTTPPMKTLLHLLTPTPYAFLHQARVLVKGEIELPIWGMLDFRSFFKEEREIGDVAGIEPGSVPYLQWGKAPVGAFGAEKRRVRRNLMRRGQM